MNLRHGKGDDARAGEKHHRLERAPDLREEADMLAPAALRLGDGGKLPRLHENARHERQDRRHLVRHGVDTVGVHAEVGRDHIAVGHARDPPEHRRRDHGDAVGQHLPRGCPAGTQHQLPPEPFAHDQKQRARQIRQRDREHIARDAHAQADEEEDVEPDDERGIDHALHGEERRVPLGTHELRAQRVQTRAHRVERDQPEKAIKLREEPQQRQQRHEQQRARKDRIHADGKNVSPLLGVIHGEAEHTIRDTETDEREKQIGRLRDEVGGAVIRRCETARVKAHHEKHQQLAAEGAEADEHGVGHERFVFVVRHRRTRVSARASKYSAGSTGADKDSIAQSGQKRNSFLPSGEKKRKKPPALQPARAADISACSRRAPRCRQRSRRSFRRRAPQSRPSTRR